MSTSSQELASSAGRPRPPSGAAEAERPAAAALLLTEPEPGSLGLTVVGGRPAETCPPPCRTGPCWATPPAFRAHEPILKAVRTGRIGTEIAYGMATMGRVRADAPRAARFDAAMPERSTAFAPGLAATYDSSGMRVIADSAGGQSPLLAKAALRVRA